MAIRMLSDDFKKKNKFGSLENHNQIIIDTEGLFSNERQLKEDSPFNEHFDRAMVLFCLAVSHFVIINIKGEIDDRTRELLGVCAYSLNQLKLPKS